MTLSTPIARSAFCTMIAHINAPHLTLAQSEGMNAAPYFKLLQKQTAWLKGELKSQSNLERFYAEFAEWRQSEVLSDDAGDLGDQVVDLACHSLYLALEQLLDTECDDTDILLHYVESLYDQLDEAGQDTRPMRAYWSDIQAEFAPYQNLTSRPVPKQFFNWLSELNASLFGLCE